MAYLLFLFHRILQMAADETVPAFFLKILPLSPSKAGGTRRQSFTVAISIMPKKFGSDRLKKNAPPTKPFTHLFQISSTLIVGTSSGYR